MAGKRKGRASTLRQGSGQAGSGRTDLVAVREAGVRPVQRARHDGFTAARQRVFLKTLGETGCVRDACRVAGISSTAVYRWRDRLPDFAERWETALAMASTELEAIAWKRGVEGVEVKTVRNGEVVAVTKKPSDSILRLLMQGADPVKYGRAGGAAVSEKVREEIKEELRREEYERRKAEEPEVRAQLLDMLEQMHQRMLASGLYEVAEDGHLIYVGEGPTGGRTWNLSLNRWVAEGN